MVEVILGTANFGNNYGVLNNNNGGSPAVTTQEAINLIKYCKSVGIRKFDTASTYGPAMGILEDYLQIDADIDVLNKISWLGGSSENLESYQELLTKLMQRPIGEVTTMIQWHNWDGNAIDLEQLGKIQSKFKVNNDVHFGVTTYGVENAEIAAASQYLDCVQFEYNVLNQKVIQALSDSDFHGTCNFIVRSILLQGLLLANDFENLPVSKKLLDAVNHFQAISHSWGFMPIEVAVRSMLNYPINADLVIGATSIREIEEILESLSKGPLPAELFEQIIKLRSFDQTLADPRNWNMS